MFTTGFKYWFGAGMFGLLAAFAYGVTTSDTGILDTLVGPISAGYKGAVGEHSGYSVLLGFAGVSMVVALLLASWRDADPSSVAEVARSESIPQPTGPRAPAYWPVLGAFAAALVTLGVVVDAAFVVIGLALVLVVAMEWTITAWADRATVDGSMNRALRSKLFFPVELPVMSLLFIGVFVIAGSRILLAVSKSGSVAVAGVMATVIFLAAIAFAARPNLSRTIVNGVLTIGALGLLLGGVVAAGAGERDFHHGTEVHGDEGDDHAGEEGDESEDDADDHAEDGSDVTSDDTVVEQP
jgi:hypothetical protein